MNSRHFSNSIKKQTLDIVIDSEESALLLQSKISDINKNRLIPVIEKVLEEFSPNDELIQIEKLNIDLKKISLAEIDNPILEDRLRQALREALTNLSIKPASEALERGLYTSSYDNIVAVDFRFSRASREACQTEILKTYLTTGKLPGWVTEKSLFSFKEFFDTHILHSDTDNKTKNSTPYSQRTNLYKNLLKLLEKSHIRKRLSLQTGTDTVQQLLQLVVNSSEYLLIKKIIAVIHKNRKLVSSSNFSNHNLQAILDNITLQLLTEKYRPLLSSAEKLIDVYIDKLESELRFSQRTLIADIPNQNNHKRGETDRKSVLHNKLLNEIIKSDNEIRPNSSSASSHISTSFTQETENPASTHTTENTRDVSLAGSLSSFNKDWSAIYQFLTQSESTNTRYHSIQEISRLFSEFAHSNPKRSAKKLTILAKLHERSSAIPILTKRLLQISTARTLMSLLSAKHQERLFTLFRALPSNITIQHYWDQFFYKLLTENDIDYTLLIEQIIRHLVKTEPSLSYRAVISLLNQKIDGHIDSGQTVNDNAKKFILARVNDIQKKEEEAIGRSHEKFRDFINKATGKASAAINRHTSDLRENEENFQLLLESDPNRILNEIRFPRNMENSHLSLVKQRLDTINALSHTVKILHKPSVKVLTELFEAVHNLDKVRIPYRKFNNQKLELILVEYLISQHTSSIVVLVRYILQALSDQLNLSTEGLLTRLLASSDISTSTASTLHKAWPLTEISPPNIDTKERQDSPSTSTSTPKSTTQTQSLDWELIKIYLTAPEKVTSVYSLLKDSPNQSVKHYIQQQFQQLRNSGSQQLFRLLKKTYQDSNDPKLFCSEISRICDINGLVHILSADAREEIILFIELIVKTQLQDTNSNSDSLSKRFTLALIKVLFDSPFSQKEKLFSALLNVASFTYNQSIDDLYTSLKLEIESAPDSPLNSKLLSLIFSAIEERSLPQPFSQSRMNSNDTKTDPSYVIDSEQQKTFYRFLENGLFSVEITQNDAFGEGVSLYKQSYQYLEYLGYFLANGFLPVDALWANKTVSEGTLFSFANNLPVEALINLITENNQVSHRRVRILASHLDTVQKLNTLKKLAQYLFKGNDTLHQSLHHFFDQSIQKEEYFTACVVAKLSNQPLDFELFADNSSQPYIEIDQQTDGSQEEFFSIPTSRSAAAETQHLTNSSSFDNFEAKALIALNKIYRLSIQDQDDINNQTNNQEIHAEYTSEKKPSYLYSRNINHCVKNYPDELKAFLHNLSHNKSALERIFLDNLTSNNLMELITFLTDQNIAKSLTALVELLVMLSDDPDTGLFTSFTHDQPLTGSKRLKEKSLYRLAYQFIIKHDYTKMIIDSELHTHILRKIMVFTGNNDNSTIFRKKLAFAAASGHDNLIRIIERFLLEKESSSRTQEQKEQKEQNNLRLYLTDIDKEYLQKTLYWNASFNEVITQATSKPSSRHRFLINSLLENPNKEIIELINNNLNKPDIIAHWISTFPDSILANICFVIGQQRTKMIIDSSESLIQVWKNVCSFNLDHNKSRTIKWEFVFHYLSTFTHHQYSIKTIIELFFNFSGRKSRNNIANKKDIRKTAETFLESVLAEFSKHGQTNISGLLYRKKQYLLARFCGHDLPQNQSSHIRDEGVLEKQTNPSTQPQSLKPNFSLDTEDATADGDIIYIENAGLALLGPFLPLLFEKLNCLYTNNREEIRIKPESLSQIVHTLQYLVDNSLDSAEHLLVLNKLLCGVDPVVPVAAEIEITHADKESCEGLHSAILSHWKAMNNTSIAGLQETFLQRGGRLQKTGNEWKLTVERKTLDILLDQTPWSFSLIQHRWMVEPIHVKW